MDRIAEEQGRLDILVNDIGGGDVRFGLPPWECDLDAGQRGTRAP